MKLVKMSLVAAVAVAGLSTASLADGMMSGAKVSGSTDFRWKSWSQDDKSGNELTRGRIDLDIKSASEDGKGKVHLRLRTSSDEAEYDKDTKKKLPKNKNKIDVNKAYADYKLGSVTLGIGPKIGFPGNFSYSTIRGITVSTKVAGFTIGAAIADKDTGMEMDEKSIITAKGKVAIADLRFDYRLGADKNEYLGTDVKVKVGPATITAGYLGGQGDNNEDKSIMGADVAVAVGSITGYGAFSMSGKKGGKVTENSGGDGRAIGDIANSREGSEALAMQFGVKAKVADIAVQGYYAMATPKDGDTATQLYFDAKKSVNTQSSVNVKYYMDSTGATGAKSKNTIELRFASKF